MMRRQKKRRILLFFFVCSLFTIWSPLVQEVHANTEPKVLVIYSSQDGEIDEYQRLLDMMVGHFTSDITFKNSHDVQQEDLQQVTHLVYYGQIAEKLPPSFNKLFDAYTGYFIALGYNSEQLGDRFTFIYPQHEVVVDHLYAKYDREKSLTIVAEQILEIDVLAGDILLEAKMKESEQIYPLGVKQDQHYYFAVDNVSIPKSLLLSDVFYEIFQKERGEKNSAYIRLEDIHPLVDPQNVQAITTMLHEKKIPFMMAVIPVYTNPETGRKYHFSDSPKLLKVLKEAQKNGGSIVLHGYTHQFRDSETGEGFEFWDVENNTPIYANAGETFDLKQPEDFPTHAKYEAYMAKLIDFENNYILSKLTKGVQELTNLGLYPVAFEAPHYTMSQNGYRLLSEHFSTYVGQAQLSDKDWELMNSTPYPSKPSFFHGMELLPETLGYVRPEDSEAIDEIIQKAADFQAFEDGMLGVFYHPYLGVERFQQLIEKMEQLPNVSWIDLKQMDTWVKVDNVEIKTEDGQIVTKIHRSGLLLSSIDYPAYHIQRMVDVVVWGIVIIGGVAVLAFIGFTFYQSTRRIKLER